MDKLDILEKMVQHMISRPSSDHLEKQAFQIILNKIHTLQSVTDKEYDLLQQLYR